MAKIILALLLMASPLMAAPMGHEATLRALMPEQGRLLNGVFPGGYTGEEDDITPAQVRDYERLLGKRVAWVMFSHNWFQGRAFPAQTAGWIRGQGATPYIRLMLRSNTLQERPDPLFTLQAIIDGDFDVDLAAWAQSAARFGTPIISEFGTEMNGEWFPWNARWNGRRKGGARFQAAYRHIIDIMRANGASNVIWVFHVNNLDGPTRAWNRFERYYPGDDYIDWLGISIYSAQSPNAEWTVDFTRSLPEVMRRFSRLAPEKPVIVAEFSTDVHNLQEPAAAWADAALTLMRSGRYPNLIGFNWWNETWPNGDDPADATDFRVASSPALIEVMRKHLASAQIQGRP